MINLHVIRRAQAGTRSFVCVVFFLGYSMASGPELSYSRLRADPAIGVSDICSFIKDWFKLKSGIRNLGGLIDQIDKSQIGWKSAPQACLV